MRLTVHVSTPSVQGSHSRDISIEGYYIQASQDGHNNLDVRVYDEAFDLAIRVYCFNASEWRSLMLHLDGPKDKEIHNKLQAQMDEIRGRRAAEHQHGAECGDTTGLASLFNDWRGNDN